MCGGITTSPIPNNLQSNASSVFQGGWIDPEDPNEMVVHEGAILVFADALVAVGDPEFCREMEALKLDAQQDFNQKIIWLTTHRVERTTTHDFQR